MINKDLYASIDKARARRKLLGGSGVEEDMIDAARQPRIVRFPGDGDAPRAERAEKKDDYVMP